MPDTETYQFTSSLEISTNKLWGAHFAVPDLVSGILIDGEDRRVICTLNEKVEYQCAMLPRGDGSFLITVNKKIREQLKLQAGSTLRVSLKKDTSEYGLPMPEEMAEVLAQDDEGNKLFHALTPGKIRTLLYIAGNVKSSEKRISRSIAIVEHLKETKGKIDFKMLNIKLKESQV
ncbi:MAG: DUF1905 domain-containing protein [Lewinellaceae bacterium]|nr:DUF1905 domain-containing protein [Saprospiraceae bacterium]MCB9342169.1 DUF1905 domain-containing protein [Lewinellaceae bacterium]